jgi:thiamine-phosphate pyrophosphorylase
MDYGAQLILLAPIFSPLSKVANTDPLGLEAITRAAALTPVPILALGGITRANENDCISAGAAGIAGISYFGHPGAPDV